MISINLFILINIKCIYLKYMNLGKMAGRGCSNI